MTTIRPAVEAPAELREAPPLLLPGVRLRFGFPGGRRLGRHLPNRTVPRQAKVAAPRLPTGDAHTNSRTERKRHYLEKRWGSLGVLAVVGDAVRERLPLAVGGRVVVQVDVQGFRDGDHVLVAAAAEVHDDVLALA